MFRKGGFHKFASYLPHCWISSLLEGFFCINKITFNLITIYYIYICNYGNYIGRHKSIRLRLFNR